MKLALLTLGLLCFGLGSFAQTFDSKFLDGTIMFQLNDEPTTNNNHIRSSDKNDYGASVDISDYPNWQKSFPGLQSQISKSQVTLLANLP